MKRCIPIISGQQGEAEKEEVMEPLHNQTADNQSKPKAMSFFPLMKVEGAISLLRPPQYG